MTEPGTTPSGGPQAGAGSPGGGGPENAPPLVLDRSGIAALTLRAVAPAAGELVLPLPGGRPAPQPGMSLTLHDEEGVKLGTLLVTAVREGSVSGTALEVRPPHRPDHPGQWLVPEDARALLRRRGVQLPMGVLTGRALHAPDLSAVQERLAEHSALDGVLVLLLAGESEPTDPRHHDRVAALLAAVDELTVPAAVVLVAVPDDDDSARLVAQAYGLGHAWIAPPLTLEVGLALGHALDAGTDPDPAVSPPAVIRALARRHRPRQSRGLVVLFTGLSGSGKSTLATLLATRLLETDARSVTVLDGDRVRRHLTAGFGFSRVDRDTNVRRIGWVAAQVAGAGGAVVCAPIAPYDDTRREVRAMVEDAGGGLVLVHVATPLAECERRDRKGLYAKARAGVIAEFTGVSDPYEAPTDAEVVVDTTGLTPEEALHPVLAHLHAAGWTG